MEIKIDGIKYVLTPAQLEAAAKEHEAQKNGPVSKFNALIKAHGWTINPDSHAGFLPFMDGSMLCIRFPAANSDWSLAIMKACIHFCSSPGLGAGFPRFDSTKPGDLLRIQL